MQENLDIQNPTLCRRAFVLLPAYVDIDSWEENFRAETVPDLTPYGYHHALKDGYQITFSSRYKPKGFLSLIASKIVWRILGFDLWHVWQNRNALRHSHADIVWTHTEYEFLGFLLMRRLGLVRSIPVIAQSVWLVDTWKSMPRARKAFFTWLLRKADVCTFMSPANHAFAKRNRWGRDAKLMDFGISIDSFKLQAPPPQARALEHGKVRVLALGNDRHRDWATLHKALANKDQFEIKIASSTFPKELAGGNIEAQKCNQRELKSLYGWADVVVVPLVDNLHASGISVMLEATALGKAVVATNTGGLTHYFTQEHVWYVPVGDPTRLAQIVAEVVMDPAATANKIRAAQSRLVEMDFTTHGYARRHARLSDALLDRD